MHRRAFLKGLAVVGACPLCVGRLSASEVHPPHWSYEGEVGPGHWADLDPANAVCQVGTSQSPVDITGPVTADIPPIVGEWSQVADATLVNNGHTIQANVAPGSTLRCGGKSYTLVQFHFHAPSEHLVDGKGFAMEAHFVHQLDGGTSLGVLGVFFVPGGMNATFARLAAAFPDHEGGEAPLAGIDLPGLLPGDLAYWTYEGSLTTPPCSEVVDWRVLKAPLPVAAEDLARFTALYPMNARPVAAIDRRFILASH